MVSPDGGQLAIGLAHAALGREVFPFRLGAPDRSGHRDKKPLVKWTQVASTDPGQIRRWAKTLPQCHFGWRLPVGTVVVDVDDQGLFEATGLALPPTAGQTTPSGGFHRLYSGIGVKQTVKTIPGIDTRVGGKGFVGLYGRDAFAGEVAPVPDWLLEIGTDTVGPLVSIDQDLPPYRTRQELTVLMGHWRRAGVDRDQILAGLLARYGDGRITESDASRPWTKADFAKLADEAAKWNSGEIEQRLTPIPVHTAPDAPRLAPALPALMSLAYTGLAGEFVDLVMPTTEGDPAAVLFSFLTWFGTAVGRGPYTMVGPTEHHANLSAVIVGDTSKARKGVSSAAIKTILTPVERVPTASASTGEGIIWKIRDPRQEWDAKTNKFVTKGSGVPDKRLLILEAEFGRLLTVMARPGNTLSAVLRDAWDGTDLSVAVKGEGGEYGATDPHISLLGNITREELAALLTKTDATSGFGNRILWVYAQRRQELALPPNLDPERLADFQEALLRLLATIQARGHFEVTLDDSVPATSESMPGPWTTAKSTWIEAYHNLSASVDPGLVGKLTDRAEAQARRLAMIYALLDGADRVEISHLYAAYAVVSYSAQTVRYIAGGLAATPDENKVLDHMRGEGQASRSSISTTVFSSHRTASELDVLRDRLVARGSIVVEIVTAGATGGHPAEVWKLP